MNAFLKILAEYTIKTYGTKKLEDLCFVFPNRRSGVFFKHYLLESCSDAFWLPEVLTINEFITGFSQLETADPIDVSFELYRIYKKMANNPESYDEFYYWGEMLINDFDDLDKYLVPADKLFKNITDLKEIEQTFGGFEEAQMDIIREFWSHFGTRGLSDEKKNFIEMWNLLHPLYLELNQRLKNNGTGYEGMQYREVAESIKSLKFPVINKDKVIIAGFNALNNAERELFKHLQSAGKGLFFWDYDVDYVNNRVHEAGRFLRKNLAEFPAVDFGESFVHLKKEKKITIIDLASDLLQSKYLGKLLNSDTTLNLNNFDNTAVILGDETLLEPVLTSLPNNIPFINITMGYPLSHTPVFSFTDQLLKLQKNISNQKNNRANRFYYRDVLDLLNHQYLRYIIEKDVIKMINQINKLNMIYVKPDYFSNNSLLTKIFRKVESGLDMPGYLREILEEVMNLFFLKSADNEQYSLEKEYTYHIITRLNKLEDIFLKDPPDTGTDTFSRLFRKIIGNSRIPFQGEPLRGLQIMGILESRLLDFENIIFLSMNEGVMPRSHSAFSFIPANLRYAFGMPGREDHDAIYAYYFYRLLQRANNISILYNSNSDGLKSGEKSRYLYQLEYLSSYNPIIKTVSFTISGKQDLPILINKSHESIAKLKNYSIDGEKAFSPTAINTWIDCKLKFYFTYISKIREEEEVSEEIDAPLLGSLLHETMRLIYNDQKGKLINEDTMKSLLKDSHLNQCLNEAFRIVFNKNQNNDSQADPEGKNIIVYEVIKKLVTQILSTDSERLPFTILELEKKFESFIDTMAGKIRLYGIIDRVDLYNGNIYIIDYKTGQVDMTYTSMEDLFNPELKKRNKHILQTFLYSFLYNNVEKTDRKIIPSLIATRNIFSSDFNIYLKRKTGSKSKTELIEGFNQFEDVFRENLSLLIADMYNPNIPFSQTTDEDRCKYCSFQGICHKQNADFEI